MAQISLSDTAFEGVRLIWRMPLAVLAWAAVMFVATALPMGLLFGTIAPAFVDLMRHSMDGSQPSPADMMNLQLRWMAVNGPLMVCSLVAKAILMCAVFRAVLRPEQSRFGYLQLGVTEVLVGLVYLCVAILIFMASCAGMVVMLGFTIAAAFASKGAAVGIGLVLAVALGVMLVWLIARLALALPMTFDDGRFRMFEAWQLSKGHALQLFFVWLVAFAVVLVLELVVGSVFGVAIIGGIASHAHAGSANLFDRPPAEWAGELAPWLVLAGIALSLVAGAMVSIMYAPLAAAYRVLAPQAEPQAA